MSNKIDSHLICKNSRKENTMYLLGELTKERQKDLIHEAKIARKFKCIENVDTQTQLSLRESIGELLIAGGLKLKGHQNVTGKRGHLAKTTGRI